MNKIMKVRHFIHCGIYKSGTLLHLYLTILLLSSCNNVATQGVISPTPETPAISETPACTATLTKTATGTASVTPEIILISNEQPVLNLTARSAVLISGQTGEVLFEKDAFRRMYPASTTKVMTALLALEFFEPDEEIFIGEEVNQAWTTYRINAQKASLEYGQVFSMNELLHGLLLFSGSDAAFVIAVNVARRESGDDFMPIDRAVEHFSDLMNERAAGIGAVETHFVNPDGFHDPDHYSTAYDMALIAREAMQNTKFSQIVATLDFQTSEISNETGSYKLHWKNTNRLIDPLDVHYYEPANGIKTGTTPEAGSCLISSAVFDGQLAIAVVLDSMVEDVWSDSVTLLEYAKENLQEYK